MDTLQDQQPITSLRDFTGGVNDFIHPTIIKDNQSELIKNADHSTPGLVKTRNGFTQYKDTAVASRIRGMFQFTPDNATKLLLAISNANPQVLYKTDGSSNWTSVGNLAAFSSSAEIVATQANNKIYFCDGAHQAQSFDGTTITTMTDAFSGTTPHFPGAMTSICWWMGRMWVAGTSTAPGVLYFSFALNPEKWDTTNQAFKPGYGTGDRIVALVPFRNEELIIFMTKSVWRLRPSNNDIFGVGSFGFPTNPSFILSPITETIGCGASRSVAVVGKDMIFMDQYGRVRSLRRTETEASQGVEGISLSYNIGGSIPNSLNAAQISKCTAIFHDRKYYLSYPSTSASDVDQIFVYDSLLGSWAGPWTFDSAGGFSRFVVSDIEGQVYLYGSRTQASFEVFRMESGTTDDGVAISFNHRTKRISHDIPYTKKKGKAVIVSLVSGSTATVTIKASADGGGFSTLGTMQNDGGVGTLPQDYPFNLGTGGIVRKPFRLTDMGTYHDIQFDATCSDSGVVVQVLGYDVIYSVVDPRRLDLSQ